MYAMMNPPENELDAIRDAMYSSCGRRRLREIMWHIIWIAGNHGNGLLIGTGTCDDSV
jgi:hypothetical protein